LHVRSPSGATNIIVQAGPVQSTTDLQTFKNNAGTVIGDITSAGSIYLNRATPFSATDIAGFYGGVTRMSLAAGIELINDFALITSDSGLTYSMIFGIS
jgi:hypothetical protein